MNGRERDCADSLKYSREVANLAKAKILMGPTTLKLRMPCGTDIGRLYGGISSRSTNLRHVISDCHFAILRLQ